MEEKEKKRLRVLYNRIERKISAHDIFVYRVVKLVKENPEVDLNQIFKEDVINNLILLDKIRLELGVDIYHYQDKEKQPKD